MGISKTDYEKYWNKLDLEKKRDMLVKYYPNPQKRWSISKQMMLEIHKKEVLEKPTEQ